MSRDGPLYVTALHIKTCIYPGEDRVPEIQDAISGLVEDGFMELTGIDEQGVGFPREVFAVTDLGKIALGV